MDNNKKKGELDMKIIDGWRLILPPVSITEGEKEIEEQPNPKGEGSFKNVYEMNKKAVK